MALLYLIFLPVTDILTKHTVTDCHIGNYFHALNPLPRSWVEGKFFSSVFLPLTTTEACEKSSWWLWKESCVSTGVRKPGNTRASPTAMI